MRDISLCQCDLILHDYLYFATASRNYTKETGPFIHNYALTYAIGWAKSEWRQETQKPRYTEQLAEVKGIYVTPAKLLTENSSIMTYRMGSEGYTSPATSGQEYSGYKITRCFGPGSVFRFYVLTRSHTDWIPFFIRLGRYMAKAEIKKCFPLEIEVSKGDYTASPLLNWDDMAVSPIFCDIIVNAQPSRLIENARFIGNQYLWAKFTKGEEVKIPLEMGYLRNELCSSWWESAA